MDDEKEKQIQEMTDKIFHEMKEQEAKEGTEQITLQTNATQTNVVQTNTTQNNNIQNNATQPPLPPTNFKNLVWKLRGLYASCAIYLIFVERAYSLIHKCDNIYLGDKISCGQTVGWTILFEGIPHLCGMLFVAIVGLTLVIVTGKQLKKGKPGVDYPPSYNTFYYIGVVLYILSIVGGTAFFIPLILPFFVY